MKIQSASINNKKVYAFQSKQELLKFIEKTDKILIALNAEKLNKRSPELDSIINSNIGYPDGIGAVLALKRKGIKSIKIAGAEFWLDIIRTYQKSKSFYLIGATQEVIDETITKLKNEIPGINIVGYQNGYLKDSDRPKLLENIKSCKPDVIFIAMGSPKQEFLMFELSKQYKALYMGLGGSFDVYTNKKKRAPKLFIALGLEWFYRLLQEPTRYKRQLTIVSFSLKVLTNRI